ncbi:hypothetical protein Kpol_526p37 [Vanderwaltozyma polyspora DSM 70294]|uniref:Probable cytosolic iron-sulfur protein assembly protein 1 n=1 Tax=Vanderwaltozyma polyspora (strain ATCC 22028 / DSM 70294 / BCRC 21397 / CBS 2163 / NBRC 10782 / NRRL Y-8283 / UCD 57-17) TaxID=436907 RepID=CIAO1_VANPO|nr:uncharacterized protein Kpol_526p37 [Vanderwaltozyma polyspora DSM 70294]A7TLU2.1 RecName: Full=Probable cytosolic iron-sulfur protein assembly protein 1 [Vanderwaltozyma polyspora DSM 70294]EDO16784.1 hypothetical protein Kpol_526p37 [Vanderwaltozyma polyspora DSM 70294]
MSLNLVKALKLHNEKIWDIDCYKGLLATASTDRRIKIVNIGDIGDGLVSDDGRLLDELDDSSHKKTVRSVAWRPHSTILAAGSFDSTVSIWAKDENDGDADGDGGVDDPSSFSMELLAVIEGHENEVKSVAWSKDGYFLATCSRDKSVWIWESDEMGEEYECISVLQEHSQDVKHVVWHPFKDILASSSYDDTIRIWKEYDDDWEAAAVLKGHEGTVWGSDFEKNVNTDIVRLCSGSDDTTVKIWRCVSNESIEEDWICEATLPNVHGKPVYSVSWSEDGLIASAGSDGMLVIYKENKDNVWEVVAKHEHSHSIYEINVVKWIKLNNGKSYLATAGDDGYVNIWAYN